ncbi:MAG: hypothetical protein ACD_79C00719G0004 [uncultured bacterium]|nr:MAG: hypothetical protein ACD_79C00719G0004 [uncultured bacterium]
MKMILKNTFFILLYTFGCLCFYSFASIDKSDDISNKNKSESSSEMSFITNEALLNNSNTYTIPLKPLYLNRSMAMMTSFSSLPDNYLITLKQFYLSYELNKNTKMTSHAYTTDFDKNKYNEVNMDISRNISLKPFSIEPFIKTTHKSLEDETSLVALGARGKTSVSKIQINGEFTYEDFMVSKIENPGFKASLNGMYSFESEIQPQVKVAWQYADSSPSNDNAENNFLELYSKNQRNIFSPENNNISILNFSLACSPKNNMFMSIDYYHYLQDQLQKQAFSKNYASYNSLSTNGTNKDLGQEIDLKATFLHSEFFQSSIFAGWFERGEAYSNTDNTKTFEIKGEIIVNF